MKKFLKKGATHLGVICIAAFFSAFFMFSLYIFHVWTYSDPSDNEAATWIVKKLIQSGEQYHVISFEGESIYAELESDVKHQKTILHIILTEKDGITRELFLWEDNGAWWPLESGEWWENQDLVLKMYKNW